MTRTASIAPAGAVLLAALVLAGPAAAGYKAKIAGGTLTLTGNAKGDKLALRLKKNAPGILQVDVGANGTVELSFRRSRFTKIVVNAGGGHDTVTIDERRGVFTTTEATTLRGGRGNDRLNGGRGGEALDGGPGKDVLNGKGGNDSARGGPGADTLSLGGGDDEARSVLGDGSEAVTGGPGTDTFRLAGTNAGDALSARAVGAAARLTRNVDGASVRAAVERLVLAGGAGGDVLTVADLAGSGVTQVEVNTGTAGAGDGAADDVVVEGTSAPDNLVIGTPASMVEVSGVAAPVAVTGLELANDELRVDGLGGADTITTGILVGVLVSIRLEGGEGADTLHGSMGPDVLVGGPGSDTIDGNQGADVVFGGEEDDTLVWDPGDGNDVLEGQDGSDTLLVNGFAGAETFTASANGSRLLFQRNVGNVVLDADDVESLVVNALGGADSVIMNGLLATDLRRATVELGVGGAGDGSADSVAFNTGSGLDAVVLGGSGGSFTLAWSAFTLVGSHAEPANDSLSVGLSSGDDLFSAAVLAATSVALTVDGGSGADVLVGSQGADQLNGAAGDDILRGGAGNDTLMCGADVDYAEGGAGADVDGGGCETFVQ